LQIGEEEIQENAANPLFQSSFDDTYLQSYIFIGLTLQSNTYSRSQLAGIAREINRFSAIPIMVLVRYGEYLTLALTNRRPHKLDRERDVLEKITLIKDIHLTSPHRAHLEILQDLALVSLQGVRNFDDLHAAWQKVLSTSTLNERFFREVSNWYFWAVNCVTFPDGAEKDTSVRNATSVIRLITRLIFVWFLKEKGLVPEELFRREYLEGLLKSLAPDTSTYYRAILQNLFFATLNTEMSTPQQPDKRKFRGKATTKSQRDQNFLCHNVYRYADYFLNSADFLSLCSNIPFLNGGLFECLDKDIGTKEKSKYIRIDGFSDRADNPLSVPNFLFFGEEQNVDLNSIYGTKNKTYRVQGILDIFNRYKFTVDENTPIEEEIALNPELLGKVFENLLAEYNPETETTARKQTGSFYTPREIVNYMVDEALLAYFRNWIPPSPLNKGGEENLRHLLSYHDEPPRFREQEVKKLIQGIDKIKIIDIACGSGAFPMGILQKLVFILGKLDPKNIQWKHKQREKAIQPVLQDIQVAKKISYEEAREEALRKLEQRLGEIEQEFANNEMDYPRKLFLIENCIFGVDIQPIAVQIAKLRFFISLIVDQKINDNLPNRGILPLPNLETKFVAANSLVGIETELTLRSNEVIAKEIELKQVRNSHFNARTPANKRKFREKDAALRQEISELLKSVGFPSPTADTLARWNPYDLNTSADFFDPEWMFGVAFFDICIGNPPYVRQEKIKEFKPIFKLSYDCFVGAADLYVYFFERGIKLLDENGILSYISSNKYFRSGYGEKLREFLSNKTQLRLLIDFGDAPVFNAIAYPSIIVLERVSNLLSKQKFRVLNWQPSQPLEDFVNIFNTTSFLMEQKSLKPEGWQLEDNSVLDLLEKLRKAGTPLGEYVNGRFYYGIKTGVTVQGV
jgi:hypothetical protein